MNGVELFLLGRTLMKIGEEAMPTEGIGEQPAGVRTVLIVVSDVRDHPETTVGEVAARTGLPQSAVSAAVARLKAVGALETMTDPRDRRRTLIRESAQVSERVADVRATPVDDALAAALDTDDRVDIAETLAMLEELARRLIPRTLTR
ncbi:MarR family transcriptional regulator [Nonomuraea rhizosphaerae]|uniref:MarR family transcriptional regulator n=1 Tax=Nonomuraea rhizosphaerae TaxID=2665663 RepID=UPI001C5E183B|nr:MarR family transcriptional regulator [Nonomuraea rhizosphaerae]